MNGKPLDVGVGGSEEENRLKMPPALSHVTHNSSSTNTLRAPVSSFFSTHRRRSKTYSGEEFAQHFNTSSSSSDANQTTGSMMTTSESVSDAKALNDKQMDQEHEHPKDLPNINTLLNRRSDVIFSNRRSQIYKKHIYISRNLI